MGNNRIRVFTPGLLSRVNNPVWSEARVSCPGSGTYFGECGDMTATATVSVITPSLMPLLFWQVLLLSTIVVSVVLAIIPDARANAVARPWTQLIYMLLQHMWAENITGTTADFTNITSVTVAPDILINS